MGTEHEISRYIHRYFCTRLDSQFFKHYILEALNGGGGGGGGRGGEH